MGSKYLSQKCPIGDKLKNSFPNIDIFVRCQFFKAEYGGEHTEEVLQRGGALKVLPRLIYTINSLIQVFKIKP